jgi:hypothetical protein
MLPQQCDLEVQEALQPEKAAATRPHSPQGLVLELGLHPSSSYVSSARPAECSCSETESVPPQAAETARIALHTVDTIAREIDRAGNLGLAEARNLGPAEGESPVGAETPASPRNPAPPAASLPGTQEDRHTPAGQQRPEGRSDEALGKPPPLGLKRTMTA